MRGKCAGDADQRQGSKGLGWVTLPPIGNPTATCLRIIYTGGQA